MKLWFRINGLEFSSWVVVWQELCNAFCQEGVEVYTHNKPPDNIKDYIEMWWCDPQYWLWSGLPSKLKVGIALSEHHSILAEGRGDVIRNMQNCDILLCPSYSAMLAFQEAPIDVPIYLMPFGVNDEVFRYIERDFNSSPFSFLHLGVIQFRKGSWLVPEAFLKAFSKNDDVVVNIISHRSSIMLEQLKNEYKNNEQIRITKLFAESANTHYSNHHIFVSPHLSEGFGLCIPEAMATGMPCIVSRCSSPREFFDKKYGWWIEMSELYAPVNQCLLNTAGVWRLPDVNSLAENMRYAYEHRQECAQKGKLASEYILSNLTWRHSARRAISVIEKYL